MVTLTSCPAIIYSARCIGEEDCEPGQSHCRSHRCAISRYHELGMFMNWLPLQLGLLISFMPLES
ncbi:hypothetical protein RchiOBHm_Chr1g0343541 [Rosa chinensis]|uniref:Uncharacterized protein n=1 Tax=Rosa chinensis TaxID=74649 RepID=A0A2P6SEA6_ROSCH|nr:hypothetical protein RchiOBHm_Chr1g0343541 [Rosa chinensis]